MVVAILGRAGKPAPIGMKAHARVRSSGRTGAAILLALAASLLPLQRALAAPACVNLIPRLGGGALAAQSGKVCVGADMLVDSRYRPFSHGASVRGNDSILLLVAADNIVVDLQQHTLVGNAPLRAGIETPTSAWQNYPDVAEPILPQNVTIRNGNLRMTSRASWALGIRIVSDPDLPVSVGSDLVGRWQAQGGVDLASAIPDAEKWAAEVRARLPASPAAYPARKVVIENMKIRTRGVGIAVQGAGTIIRNCSIEVDAGTAIWIFGPNALIENNTIIVHGSAAPLFADAPIRLHHGDGARIRNNTIIVKGAANGRAVSVFDTAQFTLEGNAFYGIAQDRPLVEAFLGTPHVLADKNTYGPLWKTWSWRPILD